MTTRDRDTLAACIAAAQKGDVAAYGRVVEQTEHLVSATVRGLVFDPDDAEDVLQEAYLKAYRRLHSLRDPQAAVAWLQRIARSVALNSRRARHLSFVDVDVYEAPDPRPAASDEAAAQGVALQHALTRLCAADRQLCERYYHGGWPTSRLAADLELSEAAVRKRLQRVRDRLRKEMTMGEPTLPDRILELLSRPNLTELPENPVGAIWNDFQSAFDGFEVVDLPERLDRDDMLAMFGDADPEALAKYLSALERQDWLRRDLTKAMLIHARDAGREVRFLATGKCYRLGDGENETRMHAFHQAEALWVGQGLDEWALMSRVTAFLDELTGGSRLRITQTDFALDCIRGWTVGAEWKDGQWQSVCGWGRIREPVVRCMGLDPTRYTALGVGIGLERLACLRYGIDDIRKVAAARV